MRRLICFLLVACLLFSAWAFPAKAFVITGTAVMGSMGVVVSILAGLGLTVYSIDKISSWTSLVSQAQSHLNDQGLVDSNGNMQLLYSDGLTYLPVSVIQDMKDWLFDSNYVQSVSSISYPSFFSLGSSSFELLSCNSPVYYGLFVTNRSSGSSGFNFYRLIYSASEFTFKYTDSNTVLSGGFEHSLYIRSIGSGLVDNPPSYATYLPLTTDIYDYSLLIEYFSSNISNDLLVSSDLSLCDVPPVLDLNIEANYPTWAEGIILSPPVTQPGGSSDDDSIPYIPISVYPYVPENPSIPRQPDVWIGISDDVGNDDEDVPVAPDNTGILSGISSFTKQIVADLSEFKDSVVEWFEVTWAAFVLSLMTALTEIKEGILAIPGLIVDAVSAVGETVKSIWDWLTEVFGLTIQQILDILSAIKDWALGLVDALITALEAMLVKLFVPDIAALEAAVSDLRLQFPFFDSIILTGQTLLQSIGSGSPPVIYAHLGAAEGNYAWGGTVAVLDMSFYSRYKATGDAIISAALYAFFAWRNFVRLPNIISGVGSDIRGL